MKTFAWLLAALMLSACSTVHYNKNQVLSRQNNIALLKSRLDHGLANQVDLLAPNAFERAQGLFKRALGEAERSKDPNAGDNVAKEGLALLDRADAAADSARGTLSNSLEAMKGAEEAQAHVLYPAEFKALEKTLRHAGKALEEGNQKEGIEKNALLTNEFNALHLKALKTSIAEQADQAYKEAVSAGANRLAPLTLKSAKNELDIAKRILDVEKENYPKAQFHAERAKYLALRAKYISDVLVGFKTDKLTEEQIVLWYQDQLAKIHTPMPEEISFDAPNRDVVSTFENDLANHMTNLKESEARALIAEKKIALLSEKLQAGPGRTLMEQATWEENFREVSALFTKKEAEVLKRDHDVIIRANGFYFPSGKAELLPRNFSLLNKIVTAILKYPRAHIEVEGHTDSQGPKSLNMKLSEERAKNIAEFLVKLAGIDASRVSSVGVGGERPIASNQTVEGRALNRRIEIIIKNAMADHRNEHRPTK